MISSVYLKDNELITLNLTNFLNKNFSITLDLNDSHLQSFTKLDPDKWASKGFFQFYVVEKEPTTSQPNEQNHCKLDIISVKINETEIIFLIWSK